MFAMLEADEWIDRLDKPIVASLPSLSYPLQSGATSMYMDVLSSAGLEQERNGQENLATG